jgi:transposase
MRTKDARSLSSEAQEDIRRKAVQTVLDGKKHVEAAAIFGVTRHTVNKWMKLYRTQGQRGLKAKPKGRPRRNTLKPWQAAQTVKAIEDHCPDQLKLPYYLWTREAVQGYIERRFGIRRSVWTIGRWLAEWGFTPQKPRRRAFEQDPEAVKQWLKVTYPLLRARAKGENALIYWGDEMGLRSDHASGRTFSRRGQTPVIMGTGQRFRCNMISALTNKGQLCFMVFKNRFTAHVLLDFMKRLVRQNKRKVYFIVDQHPVHRAQCVSLWLKKNSDHIRRFYLPPYSPELNPDEFLNQDVKSNSVGRQRPHNQEEMISSVRRYLYSRQRQPELVRHYFRAEPVRYAAF